MTSTVRARRTSASPHGSSPHGSETVEPTEFGRWDAPTRPLPTLSPRAAADALAFATTRARVALQPIVSLATGAITAVEALTRFGGEGERPLDATEVVLDAARAAGYGTALELRCLRGALAARDRVPADTLLFVNLSPDAVHVLRGIPVHDDLCGDLGGLVIEVTEHMQADPGILAEDLVAVRKRGAAIAVDDVGSGYAGLLRVAAMRPDFVKVDREIVAGVGDSAAQAAVLESLVTLAHRLDAEVVAEGVERLTDLAELARFDVDHVQGFGVARPCATVEAVSDRVVEACRAARRSLLGGSAVFASTAGRTRGLYSLTAALASAGTVEEMSATLSATAGEIGVDSIVLSVLCSEEEIREIAHAGDSDDCTTYSLEDYPATLEVMRSWDGLEVQADDALADAAERRLMHKLGWASMLIVPVHDGDRAFGILEFAQRIPRRWTAHDIAHARGLAEHLGAVMTRLSAHQVG